MLNFDDPATRAVASNRSIATLDMELEQFMQGSYPHFMLKEIFEQPESLTQTMRGRVLTHTNLPAKMRTAVTMEIYTYGISRRIGDFRRSSRISFVACGTSFHS